MLSLEFLDARDQLLHVGDRPDEDLKFEFLLLAPLLAFGAFLFVIVPVLANARRDKSTKGIEGLVYLGPTSLLDTGVILPAKRVACRPRDLPRLLRSTLRIGSGRRSGSLVVIRIVVALELVRL